MSIYRVEEYSTAAYTLAPDWTRHPLPTLYAVTKDDTPVDGHIYTDDRAAEHARACLDYAEFGSIRRKDGTWAQASTSLGGYPLMALTGDNSVLCSRCALTDAEAIPLAGKTLDNYDRRRRIESLSIHWEGRPIYCDGCSTDIPSAYGPTPDEEAQDAAELANGEETHR